MNQLETFATEAVQLTGSKSGPISPIIAHSAAFGYEDSITAEEIFSGTVAKPVYARMGNPTSSQLETILAKMDGGVGCVTTSSGMAAISMVALSLCESGDEIISVGGLFGGTYALFNESLNRFGVKTHFFDVDEIEQIQSAITPKTKMIFLESVGNPNLRLPDFKEIERVATANGILLAVDNTVTPLSLQPLKFGADIVLYSTTKTIAGHAAALGGAAVFREIEKNDAKLMSTRYKDLHKFVEKAGANALIAISKKRAMRDFGMSSNAFAGFLTMIGIQTLSLRTERIKKTIETLSHALYDAGVNVRHPSLKNHEHHARYIKEYENGCGPLLTIDFGNKDRAFSFLEQSKLITVTANIGDTRTLGLHMASTIYSDFDDETRKFLGITDGLVRISIGLENETDLINDFLEAAK